MIIFNFKVDFEESKILDEDFESFMDKVIAKKHYLILESWM